MKRIIKWMSLGVIVVVFAGTLLFLYNKSQASPVVYQVDSPAKMTIIKKTVATGKVIPRREIEVKSQVSGVVERLYVVAGQKVKKGATIARISLRPSMLNVNSAEAQLQSARINLRNQESELERYRKMYEQRIISDEAARKHTGFGDDDAPTEEELEQPEPPAVEPAVGEVPITSEGAPSGDLIVFACVAFRRLTGTGVGLADHCSIG